MELLVGASCALGLLLIGFWLGRIRRPPPNLGRAWPRRGDRVCLESCPWTIGVVAQDPAPGSRLVAVEWEHGGMKALHFGCEIRDLRPID